ncbi:N,N-dimethylformamidase beta subunit family domain-containing protein, partial [Ciceribacter ferrooxidans]|uniref:N,N-dimethylformamidase beta subunit family domain-containing protein n=1 Tax=Ciceribacter ferrooxidans TaxID=2509717 RepID=UPI00196A5774
DSKGVAKRNIICYKVQTDNADLARDPMYNQDNSVVTSMWRDPVVGRPENALVGIMFSDLTHAQFGFPWTADAKAANSPLFKNTG